MSAAAGFNIVASRLLCETPFLKLMELDLQVPTGDIRKRSVVQIGGAVSVVPMDGEDVVLIRQYRTPLDRALLELPAGKLDVPGEDAESAARRELAEEAGFRAGYMEQIAQFHTSPGFLDEHMTVFVATELTPVPVNPIGPEEVAAEIVRIPMNELARRLPEIEDGKTLVGLMAVLLSRSQE
jgi:ADP-ribose pyrophosphatase